MRKRFRFDLALLNRHRMFVYGFSALWIMLLHMPYTPSFIASTPLIWVKNYGVCGVDIFVLLSAFGLYHSLEREPRLTAFYRKRLLRVALPSFVVTAVYYGFKSDSLLHYVSHMTFFPYWLEMPALWYVSFILTMYLIYPFLHRLQKRTPFALWILFALSLAAAFATERLAPNWYSSCNSAICRIPIFILGCIFAPAAQRDGSVSGWLMPLSFALFFPLAVVFANRSYAMLSVNCIFLSIFMIMLLCWAATLFSRYAFGRLIYCFFAFSGTISLEIYLLYSRITTFLSPVLAASGSSPAKQQLACILFTFLLSIALQRFCKIIADAFRTAAVPADQ